MSGPLETERELVGKVIAGSRTAFGELVGPHSNRLLTLAARMLGSRSMAEDALQNALASVWLARHRLDAARPIGPYLTTTLLNKCRDLLRRRKAARLFGIQYSGDDMVMIDESPDAETIAVDRQELSLLQSEIERLPIKLREALVLVTIDGRSQSEAAELMGVSEKAIETRIYRARKQLREKIDNF